MYNKKEIKVENASTRKKKNPNMKEFTNKNIQSSMNLIVTARNEDLFGPRRKKYYSPYEDGGEFNTFESMKKNMKKGGEAFPTQPTAEQFFSMGYIPTAPVAFYQDGGQPCFECGSQKMMADGGENWIQEASSKMKAKGTKGAFTDYCGGKVTSACIEAGLNSPDPTTRKRAAFAKAMHTIQKAMGGEADARSTDDYLNEQNTYFKNALNYNSLNSQMEGEIDDQFMRKGGMVKYGPGGDFYPGTNIPVKASTVPFSGDPNLSTHPNFYTQTPTPAGYGYNPNMGWLAGFAGRFGPRYKINVNNYGIPQQGQQQGPGQAPGAKQTAPQATGNMPAGKEAYVKVNKAGILNQMFPKKFGPKSFEVGYRNAPVPPTGATPPVSADPQGQPNPFGTGFPPAMYGPNLPTGEDYGTKSIYSPFTTFPTDIGPRKNDGSFRKGGGIPYYADGGDTVLYSQERSLGFDTENINPDNVIAFEQQAANFLNAGQNKRIMDEQMARNMDVMNFSPTDTQFDRGYNMFDPTIMQNPEKTGVQVTSAGQSNITGQRGGYGFQNGGQFNEGDEVEMSDEELEQFFRNGGTVEYID